MDILQVSQFYAPHTGGIERVTQQISEGLTERGHNVKILSGSTSVFDKKERVNGIPVTRLGSLGELLSVPLTPTLPLRLRRQIKNADLVHYHLPHPLATVSHLAVAPSDTPVICTYHSDIVRQSIIAKFYHPLLKLFLSRVDCITVTSPKMTEHSRILTPYTKKCAVTPLAIDLDKYDDNEESIPDIDIDESKPILLFVGRLVYYKGLEYLIDAMDGIDANLLIIGDGDCKDNLESQAITSGVADKVQFLGYVPDNQLSKYYKASDVFVLPSSAPSEAFGIVQLEAMAYATPVVNTALPSGVPWVSKNGETGITVPPRDSTELAKAINEILQNPSKKRRYGRNARRRVEQQFSKEQLLDRFESLYHRLVNQSKS